MATGKRKEPLIVFIIFIVLLGAVVLAFALRGNIEYFEGLDPQRLYLILGVLAVIYILYVELRGKQQMKTLVDEKIKTHTLVDALPQAVMVLDEGNVVVTANDAACRKLEIDSVDSVGMALSGAFDQESADKIRFGGAGKIDAKSHGGTPIRVTVAPMKGEAGRLVIIEDAAPAPAAAPAASAPSPTTGVWDALLPLDKLMDSIPKDVRRVLGSALIRARKMLNSPQDVDAVPDKAAKDSADLAAIVGEACEKSGPIARARGITLDMKANGNCTVMADRALLRRAVDEILVNACTYAPDECSIKVEVEGGENEVLVRITDPGIGIPSEEFSKVFDVGFVGSNQVPDGAGGRGVGLAVARKVVESHGGSIWVESQTGKGTRISLNIPRK